LYSFIFSIVASKQNGNGWNWIHQFKLIEL
jgi:hypothetical protein